MNNLANDINSPENIMNIEGTLPEKFKVNTAHGETSLQSSVRLNNGNIVTVYLIENLHLDDRSVDQDTIFAQRYDASGTEKIGSEIKVNAQDKVFFDPTVTSLSNGNFVVIWKTERANGGNDDDYGVFAKIYNPDGEVEVPGFAIHSEPIEWMPAASPFSSGGFVVTWSEYEDSFSDPSDRLNVFAKIYDNAGVMQKARFLVNTHTSFEQQEPAVITFGSDNFLITWHSNHLPGHRDDIFAQKFDKSGNKVGDEFQVNTNIAFDDLPGSIGGVCTYVKPTASTIENDNFIISWVNEDTENLGQRQIVAQMFNSTCAPIGTEFQVNTTPNGQKGYPQITSNINGDFIITWIDSLGGGDVIAQRFNKEGEKQGPEIPVSLDDKTNSGKYPAVTSTVDGGFVAVWAEGYEYTVWSRKFPANYIYEPSSSSSEFIDSSQGSGGNSDGDGSSISSASSDYITPGVLLMGLGATIYNAIADFDII